MGSNNLERFEISKEAENEDQGQNRYIAAVPPGHMNIHVGVAIIASAGLGSAGNDVKTESDWFRRSSGGLILVPSCILSNFTG